MNAVEIEEAVSELAGRPFDPFEFPYAFLTAFGNKDTTIKRLRTGNTNASDIPGGVLQRNHIHITACPHGMVRKTIVALRESPKTTSAKARFVLATDGVSLEAEDLVSGEPIACAYSDFAKHFGFFLPLAGISTVKEIKDNPFDVKATGKLNKLYVQLLKDNPDWATEAKRPALNQFITRLIFCFFAEDTGIFMPKQFTKTVEQMSDGQSGNTHEVLCELFRAMDLKPEDRAAAGIKSWADRFPYVNGGMFAGGAECPKFSKIARSYLLTVGNLEWDKINPDIFGSMIQAVADDAERGDLGMHYTSVPNILKVLNPLFLDDLRDHLKSADDNVRKLRNLRKRLSIIRVFDPACGSGNFLVIAYKEMRAIEHEIVKRTGDEPKSWIKLDNFFGIEIKSFAVEIARLALLIAEFQCDVLYISQQEARAMVLPLHRTGQIVAGNALKLDWLKVCPPESKVLVEEHDLGGATGRLALEENGLSETEPETYVCGNPPYYGSRVQNREHKDDLRELCGKAIPKWKSLDYVAGWFLKAVSFCHSGAVSFAFVSTSSLCEGLQVPVLWPHILIDNLEIFFAHRPFMWSNLAAKNAGVAVVIVGLAKKDVKRAKAIFSEDTRRAAVNINPYLLAANTVYVDVSPKPICQQTAMVMGSMPRDGGNLILSPQQARELVQKYPDLKQVIRKYVGSDELINGNYRRCLWIPDDLAQEVRKVPEIAARLEQVSEMRRNSPLESTVEFADRPHRFVYLAGAAKSRIIATAGVSSEHRPYLPVDLLEAEAVGSNLLFAMYDPPLWNFSLISSRLHLVWIATVCGKLETRYRYSNTLGWNTFPVPSLTDQNKNDLEHSSKNILLAREAFFPSTLADLYEPEGMPKELREAHDANDEIVERIYVGRRFRNDTERLETLFGLYSKMILDKPLTKKKAKRAA